MEVLEKLTKLTDKTLISLHVVIIIIGFAVWLIRLGDRVDQHEKVLTDFTVVQKEIVRTNNKIDQRLYRLETKFGIKHPNEIIEGE